MIHICKVNTHICGICNDSVGDGQVYKRRLVDILRVRVCAGLESLGSSLVNIADVGGAGEVEATRNLKSDRALADNDRICRNGNGEGENKE